VFAIASRSYVIGVIINNRPNTPYHVKNTNKHQTYSGVHADPVLKAAVEQTKGIFLAYEKNPITAMFDSCCGGVIPANIHGANFSNAPYLARKYACTYCKDCKMFNWTAHYSLDQFEKMIQKEFKHIKTIKSVKVAKTDKAGLVQHVSIKGHHKLFSIPGKKIYSMLTKVKSFCFDIVMNANKVIFNGKGIGHHMGLCQWGAREMVRQGYDYKSILSFYYPDTHFMRLQ
jgi:stage II sporulation protein D